MPSLLVAKFARNSVLKSWGSCALTRLSVCRRHYRKTSQEIWCLLSGIAQKRGGWACSNFWPVFHKVHICPGYLYTFQRPKKQGCTGGAFCLRDQVGFLSCNYHTEFEWIELKFALLRPTGFVIFAGQGKAYLLWGGAARCQSKKSQKLVCWSVGPRFEGAIRPAYWVCNIELTICNEAMCNASQSDEVCEMYSLPFYKASSKVRAAPCSVANSSDGLIFVKRLARDSRRSLEGANSKLMWYDRVHRADIKGK